MPNYCSNELTVEGPPDDIELFVTANSNAESCLTFHAAVPIPPELCRRELHLFTGGQDGLRLDKARRTARRDFGYANAREMQVAVWGTKWDAANALVHDVHRPPRSDRASVSYEFDTAWSPPTTWLATASEQWPTLTFTLAYDEPGCDFGGYQIVRDGDLVAVDQGPSRASTWFSAAEHAHGEEMYGQEVDHG